VVGAALLTARWQSLPPSQRGCAQGGSRSAAHSALFPCLAGRPTNVARSYSWWLRVACLPRSLARRPGRPGGLLVAISHAALARACVRSACVVAFPYFEPSDQNFKFWSLRARGPVQK
jgi:hypothetical protein